MYSKMPSFLIIQKSVRVNSLTVSGFASTLKPNFLFYGSNYKYWCERMILWLMAMIVGGKPIGLLTVEEERAFEALFGVSNDGSEVYAMELWDALEAKFGASDTGSELYAMEHF
jgi:hypothetical protein